MNKEGFKASCYRLEEGAPREIPVSTGAFWEFLDMNPYEKSPLAHAISPQIPPWAKIANLTVLHFEDVLACFWFTRAPNNRLWMLKYAAIHIKLKKRIPINRVRKWASSLELVREQAQRVATLTIITAMNVENAATYASTDACPKTVSTYLLYLSDLSSEAEGKSS